MDKAALSYNGFRRSPLMDALIRKLDSKLREWKPETAAQVRQHLSDIIDAADQDTLDLMRSRAVEQEVLDLIDDAPSG